VADSFLATSISTTTTTIYQPIIHQPSITATILSITPTCAFVWRLLRRQMNLHPRYIQLISSHPSKLKGSDIT
jgi:hypothetical protein